MPIFDFRCENESCDEFNKIFESMTQPDAPVLCPICLEPTNRLVSAPPGRVRNGTPRFHQNSRKLS